MQIGILFVLRKGDTVVRKFIVAKAVLFLCFLFVCGLIFTPSIAPAMAIGDVVPGQYIITLRADAHSSFTTDQIARDLAHKHGLVVNHVYTHALKGFAATISSSELATLQRDPRISRIVPDRYVSIHAQTIPSGILRVNGDLSSTASGNKSGTVNADVAVIDTGIHLKHRDLNAVPGSTAQMENRATTKMVMEPMWPEPLEHWTTREGLLVSPLVQECGQSVS